MTSSAPRPLTIISETNTRANGNSRKNGQDDKRRDYVEQKTLGIDERNCPQREEEEHRTKEGRDQQRAIIGHLPLGQDCQDPQGSHFRSSPKLTVENVACGVRPRQEWPVRLLSFRGHKGRRICVEIGYTRPRIRIEWAARCRYWLWNLVNGDHEA